jgi:3'-phosphoadenosine 5'-phosphosulfate sulfotransferase (PAPS reductase)/FAD synthetase
MLAYLVRAGLKDKITIIHSDLGEMEWEEMRPWIEKNSFGLSCNVVKAEMDFFDLARKYQRIPSGMQQFCTDFLKTKPIAKWIHEDMKRNGYKKAINATGMRAEESPRRAKKNPFVLSKGSGTSGMTMPKKWPEHTIYDFMPIFYYTTSEVFKEIELAKQRPHEIYSQGFSRLSCVLCVNGRIKEHQEAARRRPELAKKFAKLERDLGKSVRLKQVKGKKYPKYMDEYLTAIM